jgi:hypothetical protein
VVEVNERKALAFNLRLVLILMLVLLRAARTVKRVVNMVVK